MAKIARLCLIGPECTGKTTLAEELATQLGVPWVEEFAREYALRVARPLTLEDVGHIAAGELRAQVGAERLATSALILDTDLLSTTVYSRHYYGSCADWIEREARARLADLYLLCDVDMPWRPDEVRDRPHGRAELLAEFRETLEQYGARYVVISGPWPTRVQAAMAAANELLTS